LSKPSSTRSTRAKAAYSAPSVFATFVLIVVTPVAIYDYVGWLIRNIDSRTNRWIGLTTPIAGVAIGYVWSRAVWDGCIVELNDSAGCWSGGFIGIGILLGATLTLALSKWLISSSRSG